MTITARVIADSINSGNRLTTMQLRYPRFIHAEERTHRVISTDPQYVYEYRVDDSIMACRDLSRNASSSRAIPVKRLIQDVIDDPAMPVYWGSHRPGMQAGDELDLDAKFACIMDWNSARDHAIATARRMVASGAHKQIVNRILEPFAHINVIVSATDYTNFFNLRAHPDAQPEIQSLAYAMRDAMDASTPTPLKEGEWHLPYITAFDRADNSTDVLCRMSAARCARVSYMTHDGKEPTRDQDLALYDRLAGSDPIHASPLEHQATPSIHSGAWANFKGWTQFRKYVETEWK